MFSLLNFLSEYKVFFIIGLLTGVIGIQQFRINSWKSDYNSLQIQMDSTKRELMTSIANEATLKNSIAKQNAAIENMKVDYQKRIMVYASQVEKISKESAAWREKAKYAGKDCNNTVLNEYITTLKNEGFFK